jgi:hypothetical protein
MFPSAANVERVNVKVVNGSVAPTTHVVVALDVDVPVALENISNLFLHRISLMRRIVLDCHATKGILVKRKRTEDLILLALHV